MPTPTPSILELTTVLRTVLLHHVHGYQWWSSWHIETDGAAYSANLEKLDAKLAEQYGTRLSTYERQWRRRKGLPNALVAYGRVYSYPGRVQVMLLCQPFNRAALDKRGPFLREKWHTSPPEYADLFVMSQEPSQANNGKPTWTWRIQNRRQSMMQNELLLAVKQGDRENVKLQSEALAKLPMFGGVRRQVRRMLRESSKLWIATKKTPWPGPDPEALPAMGKFTKK